MIDVEGLLRGVDLVELVSRYVKLKRVGREWAGCCPFHDERSPSFTVNPGKGFYHCFGCSAHGNAVGFVMQIAGKSFREACEVLGATDADQALPPATVTKRRAAGAAREVVWVPLLPVPDEAPPLVDAKGRVRIWNPKRERFWEFAPARVDAYRDAAGQLLGYVLRDEFLDRETRQLRKITPQVTWCVGPEGQAAWCAWSFPRPRPLLGLDALAYRPNAPVMVVSGEKCQAVGAAALPQFVVVSWPGGDNGVRWVNWRPLVGRDVLLWMDADESGLQAGLGYQDYSGLWHDGIAQLLHAAGGASRLRIVDTEGRPKGWDLADALLDDGWSAKQLCAWAKARVLEVEVRVDPDAQAA